MTKVKFQNRIKKYTTLVDLFYWWDNTQQMSYVGA